MRVTGKLHVPSLVYRLADLGCPVASQQLSLFAGDATIDDSPALFLLMLVVDVSVPVDCVGEYAGACGGFEAGMGDS